MSRSFARGPTGETLSNCLQIIVVMLTSYYVNYTSIVCLRYAICPRIADMADLIASWPSSATVKIHFWIRLYRSSLIALMAHVEPNRQM